MQKLFFIRGIPDKSLRQIRENFSIGRFFSLLLYFYFLRIFSNQKGLNDGPQMELESLVNP